MKRGYGAALALIAILAAVVVFAPVPGDTRWIRTVHNSAHAPIFGCISLLALWVIRAHPRAASFRLGFQYGLALLAAFLLGGATEILQIPVGRDASLEDALHDSIGALAFLCMFAVFDSHLRAARRSTSVRVAGALIGSIALGVAAAPVTRAAIKYRDRDQRFPVLADFSHGYDRYFILQKSSVFSAARLPGRWAASPEEMAMRVQLLDGPYPGLEFIEVPSDWSGYRTLAVDLTNPTPLDLQLVLRVHDVTHNNRPDDRFSRRFTLPARTREVMRIGLGDIAAGPQQRVLDLHQVAGIIIFRADESPAVGELYLSRAWLE